MCDLMHPANTSLWRQKFDSLVYCIWAQESNNECPGSNGPSMSSPVRFAFTFLILESLSVAGTFFDAAESGATTCSLRDAMTNVSDSNKSLLRAALSARVMAWLTS